MAVINNHKPDKLINPQEYKLAGFFAFGKSIEKFKLLINIFKIVGNINVLQPNKV